MKKMIRFRVLSPIMRGGYPLAVGVEFSIPANRAGLGRVHVDRWLAQGRIEEVPDSAAPAAPSRGGDATSPRKAATIAQRPKKLKGGK